MRVITGVSRGRRLVTPAGLDVRPTADNVKEAVFSIIQFYVEGRRFLDAFAGSGQMGIEALSRGAASAVFIDSSRQSLDAVRKNLSATGLEKKAVVVKGDTLAYLSSRRDSFDIAFLDPPYRTGLLQSALELMPDVMSRNGIVICEHPADEELEESVGRLLLKKRHKYGRIMISVYSDKDVEGI